MAGKISDATPITTLANGDLIEITKDTGGGTFATRAITYQNLLSILTAVNPPGICSSTLAYFSLLPLFIKIILHIIRLI